MTYIPIVPVVTPVPPPSPRTRELAGLLAKVLDEYTKAHPAVTKAEIRAAIRMAQMSGGSNPAVLVGALVAGLGVFGLALGLFFMRGSGGGLEMPAMPMVVLALVVFLGIVAVLLKVISR